MEKVFISYSSNDRTRAEDLCRSLEERGVACWIAPRDIPPGAVYGGAIVEAIDLCRGFVVLLSQSSNVSSHVLREVERAANKGKDLFPVRLSDVRPSRALEYFLSMPQSIDLIDPPFDRQIDRLAAAQHSSPPEAPAAQPRVRQPTDRARMPGDGGLQARWRRVEALYHAVLEHAPAESALLLEQADPELRREVESLLNQPGRNGAPERPAGAGSNESSSDKPSATGTLSAGTLSAGTLSAGTLSIGSMLGPYRIATSIGKGGMGEVWKARDTRLNRAVAIKVSRRQFTDRFEREARAISALNHPNICTLYDVGPDYLVMEYIEGNPLKGPLPVDQALKFAGQICDALDAAHRGGIIHRDLKPANILLSKQGIKLLDFGLARIEPGPNDSNAPTMTQVTQTGAVMGTSGYMAPEQWEGKKADARSDIYAFGCVLYEMLSGRRAFAGESAIGRDEPAPLQLPGGTAPAKLTEAVMRCLRKAPATRFQTMSDVRAALELVNAVRTEKTPSIAVLPFANLSGDKEQEYFSDGLAEEILNLLSKIPSLRVIARTSSFAFRGKEQDIRGIAEALGVGTILEGSVRRAGNRVRVTAQLIEADNGSHLWSERYDRDLTDIFAVQDEIGQAISEALKVQLAPRTRVVNVEAWEHWLKGVHYRARNTPEGAAKAKDHFERALAIDPNCAQAWSGLALCYYVITAMGTRSLAEMTPLLNSAARNALAIDPSDSDSHAVLASMAGVFNYDWELAGTHHRMSLACESVSPRARLMYGCNYLATRKRPAEAVEQCRLAVQADPLSMLFHQGLASCLFVAGQNREAILCARRALEIDPNFHLTWLALGFVQMGSGLPGEAVFSFGRVVELAPWFYQAPGFLAAACCSAGDYDRVRELVRRFGARDRLNFGFAVYYATAGEGDAMFEALEGSYQRRDFHLPALTTLSAFDPYRTDPRFHTLLTRMNLADLAG